ncbi:MAG: hypothetical protein J6P54_05705, partial [Bacteroidales bacterium]|nr:hypothetical protein [Bacteroidales bacterium]
MKKNSWVRFLFFILFLFQIADIQAQKVQKKITLQWTKPVSNTFSDGHTRSFLSFENAVYGGDFWELPSFYEIVAVDNFF